MERKRGKNKVWVRLAGEAVEIEVESLVVKI